MHVRRAHTGEGGQYLMSEVRVEMQIREVTPTSRIGATVS